MPARSDQAVVLRLSDYSETSQIVSLFTRQSGLARLIAKGSRRSTKKRFAAGLDLMELGDVSYIPPKGDAGLGTLTEWLQRETFIGMRRDLLRQYGGLYAIELVGRLTEEYDPHQGLYEALVKTLHELSSEDRSETDATSKPSRTIVRFQSALLREIGYSPIMRRCVSCGKARVKGTRAYFSSSAGGMLCRDCESNHAEKCRLSPAMLDGAAETQQAEDWFLLLNYHLTHVAGREYKTARDLGRLMKARSDESPRG